MNSAANQIRLIALIVIFQALVLAQAPDLAPLLPAPTPAADALQSALLSGEITRAVALADAMPPPDRELWLGILAIVRNDSTQAIRLLRRVNQPKALGVAYYLARQHLLFRDQMAEAIRRNPDDFGPYYYLGRHYDTDLDNAGEAALWFRKALDRYPAYSRARVYLGGCLERLGRTDEAESEFRASQSFAQSQLGLARLRLAAGDPDGALPLALKAQRMDPRDSAIPKLTARIYAALDRPRDALRALESAAVLDPREASLHYQIYRTRQSLGETAKAAAALREYERLRGIYD